MKEKSPSRVSIRCVYAAVAITLCTLLSGTGTIPLQAKEVSSPVTLQVDNAQISVTVPTTLPLTLQGDGTLTAPSAARITNTSVYPIRVSGVLATPAPGIALVPKASFATCTSPDALWATIAPQGKSAVELAGHTTQKELPSQDWSMEKAGSPADTLAVLFSGSTKNIERDYARENKVLDIVWTISAGNAPVNPPDATPCFLDAQGVVSIKNKPLVNTEPFPMRVTRVAFNADPLRITGAWTCSIDGTTYLSAPAGAAADITGPVLAGGASVSTAWSTTFPSTEAVAALDKKGNVATIGTITYTLSPLPLTGTLSLTGSPEEGASLSASPVGAQSDAAPTFQWYTGSTPHATTTPVGTEATYTVTKNDVGLYLTCVATDSKGWYTGSLSASTDGPITEKSFTTPIVFPTWTKGSDGAYATTKVDQSTFISDPFTVPTEGALLSFDWATSTTLMPLEYIYCEVRDSQNKVVSGTGPSSLRIGGYDGTDRAKLHYMPENIALPAGTYTVRYVYEKGYATWNPRLKEGFVKNVVLTTNDNCLETYSWADLARISQDISKTGTIPPEMQKALNRNYRKIVHLPQGEAIDFMIAGFNHDTKSDGTGKAGITFTAGHCLGDQYRLPMCTTNSSKGGWKATLMRNKTLAEGGLIWNLLPTDLTTHIVAVDKMTNNVGSEATIDDVTVTSDKIWLMSYIELAGTTGNQTTEGWEKDLYLKEGAQYELFRNLGVSYANGEWYGCCALARMVRPIGGYYDNEHDTHAWQRSLYPRRYDAFHYISPGEQPGLAARQCTDNHGILPSFAF